MSLSWRANAKVNDCRCPQNQRQRRLWQHHVVQRWLWWHHIDLDGIFKILYGNITWIIDALKARVTKVSHCCSKISRWQAKWLGSGKDNVCIDAVQRTTEGSLVQGRARWQRTNGDQMCNSLELCTGWTQFYVFQKKRRPVVKKQFPKDEFECFVTEFSPMWRKDDTHKSKLRMHDQPCPGMFTNMFSRSKPWSSTNILQCWDAIWKNMVFLGAFCLNQSTCNAMKTVPVMWQPSTSLISGSNAFSQWAVAPQNFQCRSMADSSAWLPKQNFVTPKIRWLRQAKITRRRGLTEEDHVIGIQMAAILAFESRKL